MGTIVWPHLRSLDGTITLASGRCLFVWTLEKANLALEVTPWILNYPHPIFAAKLWSNRCCNISVKLFSSDIMVHSEFKLLDAVDLIVSLVSHYTGSRSLLTSAARGQEYQPHSGVLYRQVQFSIRNKISNKWQNSELNMVLMERTNCIRDWKCLNTYVHEAFTERHLIGKRNFQLQNLMHVSCSVI